MATSYCTQTDIEENLRGVTFGAGDPVNPDALDGMITQESQVIDVHIQNNYTLPVTDVDALDFLKKICIDLVIYRVTKVLRPRNIEPIPNKATQEISHASAWKAAMMMLKSLKTGESALPSTDMKSKNFISSTLETDDIDSTMLKDTIQW